jgi:hypothetical protein
MKNELAMRLFSRRTLIDSVASEQIIALSEFRGGLMRPDKCSEFEPIRTPFDATDISGPVRWLAKTGGEFLYRKGSPVQLTGEIWNLTRPSTARFPPPLFTNYWTGQFDGKWADRIGVELLEDFVSEMFRVTGSDFGLLATEADLKAKNRRERSFSYEGMTLESGIPGLYWINFFSDEFANWLRLSEITKELAISNSIRGGGVSLKFCESPHDCRDLAVLQRQKAAIEWLGPEKFFDIGRPDRRAETPDWGKLPLKLPQSPG